MKTAAVSSASSLASELTMCCSNASSSNTSNTDQNEKTESSETSARMSVGDDMCAINELLEGRMDLSVALPDADSVVVVNVERRTPMLDLLVVMATQYRFNAADYTISASDRHFNASTPIGSLDVSHISIVPKPAKVASPKSGPPVRGLPFQATFRLQINLPRNQLMVLRVTPNASLAAIKQMVCIEKSLEPTGYQLVKFVGHREAPKILDPNLTIGHYSLNEVSLVSTKTFSRLLVQCGPTAGQTGVDLSAKDGKKGVRREWLPSVGSLKKRPAPPPPTTPTTSTVPLRADQQNNDHNSQPSPTLTNCVPNKSDNQNGADRQRHNSGFDSSGYHESVLSSDSPESSSPTATLPKCVPTEPTGKSVAPKTGVTPLKKRRAPPPPNSLQLSTTVVERDSKINLDKVNVTLEHDRDVTLSLSSPSSPSPSSSLSDCSPSSINNKSLSPIIITQTVWPTPRHSSSQSTPLETSANQSVETEGYASQTAILSTNSQLSESVITAVEPPVDEFTTQTSDNQDGQPLTGAVIVALECESNATELESNSNEGNNADNTVLTRIENTDNGLIASNEFKVNKEVEVTLQTFNEELNKLDSKEEFKIKDSNEIRSLENNEFIAKYSNNDELDKLDTKEEFNIKDSNEKKSFENNEFIVKYSINDELDKLDTKQEKIKDSNEKKSLENNEFMAKYSNNDELDKLDTKDEIKIKDSNEKRSLENNEFDYSIKQNKTDTPEINISNSNAVSVLSEQFNNLDVEIIKNKFEAKESTPSPTPRISSINGKSQVIINSEDLKLTNGKTSILVNKEDSPDSPLLQNHFESNPPSNEDKTEKLSAEEVRELCRPRVKLTNFSIGSYKKDVSLYGETKEEVLNHEIPATAPVINSKTRIELNDSKPTVMTKYESVSEINKPNDAMNSIISKNDEIADKQNQPKVNITVTSTATSSTPEKIAIHTPAIQKLVTTVPKINRFQSWSGTGNSYVDYKLKSVNPSEKHVSQIAISKDSMDVSIKNSSSSPQSSNEIKSNNYPVVQSLIAKTESQIKYRSQFPQNVPQVTTSKDHTTISIKQESEPINLPHEITVANTDINKSQVTFGQSPQSSTTGMVEIKANQSILPPPPPPQPQPVLQPLSSSIQVNATKIRPQIFHPKGWKSEKSGRNGDVPKVKHVDPPVANNVNVRDALLNEIKSFAGKGSLKKVSKNSSWQLEIHGNHLNT